jgi:diguanylate cyclase (GGDEF)-like protein
LRNFAERPVVAKALKGQFTPGLFNIPETGKTVLASYRKMPGLDWIVILEQDADEAFSIVRIYAFIIIALVLVTIVVSGVSFLYIARDAAASSREHRELLIISETDPLTGLLNRRSMLSRMNQLIFDYEQSGSNFVIALFDIDDFKKVNDTYGHVFGDVVLREIAARSVSILRVEDLLFRWGGEEFLLVIRNSDLVRGRGIAEKIRRVIADTPINDRSISVNVTVTLGVSQYHGGSIDGVIIHADEALYEGKRNGKNQIVVSDE